MAMSYCNDLTLSNIVKDIVGSEQLVPLWLEHGNGLAPIKLSSHSDFAAQGVVGILGASGPWAMFYLSPKSKRKLAYPKWTYDQIGGNKTWVVQGAYYVPQKHPCIRPVGVVCPFGCVSSPIRFHKLIVASLSQKKEETKRNKHTHTHTSC